MGIFDGSPRARRERHAALRRLRRPWWESAQAFDDEMFYDPMDSIFDPLGSYTGRPADGGLPEQDADDL